MWPCIRSVTQLKIGQNFWYEENATSVTSTYKYFNCTCVKESHSCVHKKAKMLVLSHFDGGTTQSTVNFWSREIIGGDTLVMWVVTTCLSTWLSLKLNFRLSISTFHCYRHCIRSITSENVMMWYAINVNWFLLTKSKLDKLCLSFLKWTRPRK